MIDLKELDFFILKEKTPVPVNILHWSIWFESRADEMILAETRIRNKMVTTSFIGFTEKDDQEACLFRTSVDSDRGNEILRMYPDYENALKGHHDICAYLVEEI